MHLELTRINLMSVQNSIFIGGVHQLGSCQNINLYPARVYRGTNFFRSLYAFRDPNDHYN